MRTESISLSEAVAAETDPKLPSSESTVVLDGTESVTVRTGMVMVLLDMAGDSVTVIVMGPEAPGVS